MRVGSVFKQDESIFLGREGLKERERRETTSTLEDRAPCRSMARGAGTGWPYLVRGPCGGNWGRQKRRSSSILDEAPHGRTRDHEPKRRLAAAAGGNWVQRHMFQKSTTSSNSKEFIRAWSESLHSYLSRTIETSVSHCVPFCIWISSTAYQKFIKIRIPLLMGS